jgi:hypothetical protein
VRYSSYELEAADAEHEALGRGGGNFMRLEVGKNVVRILPPREGRLSPFESVFQHFIDIPGKEGPVVFNCPRMMAKQHCPACARADKLRGSANEVDQEASRRFWATRRTFCNVIDRNDPEAGPKVLGIGKTIYGPLLELRRDEDAGGDFSNPIDGYDVIIQRQGSGKNDTKYSTFPVRRSTPLAVDDAGQPDGAQMQEWIDTQVDLGQLSEIPTLEEIRAKVAPPVDDGAPTDALPSGGRGGPSAQSDTQAMSGGGGYYPNDDFSDDDIPF